MFPNWQPITTAPKTARGFLILEADEGTSGTDEGASGTVVSLDSPPVPRKVKNLLKVNWRVTDVGSSSEF